jgi:hypothetical protein
MRVRHAVAVLTAVVPLAAVIPSVASAGGAPTGAIFTTVADGSEVNYNIYGAKEDVYLDGGPGPGAPQTAAGLDDGTYVFQVTEPSGKTLLSQDPAQCREFTVANGIIVAAGVPSCVHVTGVDIDHGAVTVQLMPYADTPNPGGEYKVWATLVGNFTCSLTGPDCGNKTGAKHGFVPSLSKTDNWKVRGTPLEIDTRFFRAGSYGNWVDGLAITHTDPLGASNVKWSYLNTALNVNHEAHVEDVEVGTHVITVANQAGCTVGRVMLNGAILRTTGPQAVSVAVSSRETRDTLRVDVECI